MVGFWHMVGETVEAVEDEKGENGVGGSSVLYCYLISGSMVCLPPVVCLLGHAHACKVTVLGVVMGAVCVCLFVLFVCARGVLPNFPCCCGTGRGCVCACVCVCVCDCVCVCARGVPAH